MADGDNGDNNYTDLALRTISRDGKVPETRMANAAHVQDFVRRMTTNDARRNRKRAMVAGLVGGNPPFRHSKMRDAGRAEDCNSNWGTAFSYVESGSGSFYDLFCEAPGIVGIVTSHGKDDSEREHFSRVMSAKADQVLREDPMFDYHMQQSQWEMVLYGCGPLWFEDSWKVLPRSAHCGDLKVPERTPADAEYFEICAIDVDYYPPQLYDFIRNGSVAKSIGWDVGFTKECISNAMDIRMPDNRMYDWEFYQQEVKNNSFTYYDDSKVVHCAVALWKEFDNRITQAIVERESTVTGKTEFMFRHIGRYANWRQVIHPMYFDRGNGGFHHSVTGLGTRCFSPMEHENRLLCQLYNKAYAPDILFKPGTTESISKFTLSHMGLYGILPAGFDVIQTPIKGALQDGLAMFKTSSELMRSNLSSYRQQTPMKQTGNPQTAKQVMLEANQQSALSKTTFNRYYRQLDLLYAEIVRRLCNLNSLDPLALKFQELCVDAGIPRECFGRIEAVRAVRVVGEGSAFLRRESVASVSQIVGSLPEDGRLRWTDDYIAAYCGQSAVQRYNPRTEQGKLPDDQDERIANQIADMKIGIPAVVTPSQNALRFAGAFLSACVQALESVKQGGNMAEVVKFVDLCAQACMKHINRIINDPIRSFAAEELKSQLQRVGKILDKMKQMLQKQQQQQREQQRKTQEALSDQAIKATKVRGDLALKKQKQDATLQMKAQQVQQDMALKDAQVGTEIHRKNRLQSFQE